MDENAIKSMLRGQLYARLIGYDMFWFASGSAAIIVHLRNSHVSISLPYLLAEKDGSFYMSSTGKTWKTNTANQAVSAMVRNLRSQEVKLSKFQ